METSLLGLVLDSSVPIAAERRKATAAEVIEAVQGIVGEIPIVLCSLTVAEIGSIAPKHRKSASGGEQAERGINPPLGDLIIGACVLELGYGVGTNSVRDFSRIPGLTVVPL